MRGRPTGYSADELAWIEAHKSLPIGTLHGRFIEVFRRPDVTAQNLHALRKRKGWKTGRTGRFEKGQAAANKGKKCEPGKGGLHPNARKTQFQKGVRQGVATKLWKPIGTERLSKEGYRERKINDDMPLQARWRAVHLIEWEALNGPLPEGMVLKCLDGDKTNTEPSNWEMIPRSLLPRLAGGNRYRKTLAYDDAEPELKPVLMAVAKLEHRARTARKVSA